MEDPFKALAGTHPELFGEGDIIDIGANIGYTAAVFAQFSSPRHRVWAFEPSSENFRLLIQNTRKFGPKVKAMRIALGDENGDADLILNPLHAGDHHIDNHHRAVGKGLPVETVRLATLDTVVSAEGIGPVCFIKIDVQGFEMNVCHGMTRTLEANPRAAIAVECSAQSLEDFGSTPDDLVRFFLERGYRGFILEQNGALTPSTSQSFGRHSARDYSDLLFLPVVHHRETEPK